MVRQGDIHEITVGADHYRVLVVSTDGHNAFRTPWVAPIRRGRADIPPYLIELHDADPLGGAIDLDRLTRAKISGEAIGTITGTTMSRVRDAVQTVFDD